jgi:hypothetical protein
MSLGRAGPLSFIVRQLPSKATRYGKAEARFDVRGMALAVAIVAAVLCDAPHSSING